MSDLETIRKLNHEFFKILMDRSCAGVKNPESVMYLSKSESCDWWLLNSLITWFCNYPNSIELKKSIINKILENLRIFISNEENRRSLKSSEPLSFFTESFSEIITEILECIRKIRQIENKHE